MRASYFSKYVRAPYDVFRKHKMFLDKFQKLHDTESNNVYILVNTSEDFIKVSAHLGFAGPKAGFCQACMEN